ncbi:MAG: type III secretion system inner membrane ring lipoprotein SctJ [Sphingomonas sp.]
MRAAPSSRIPRWLLGMLVPLALAACSGQPLYSQLTEAQANDMVSALLNANINADKKVLDGGKWSIVVPQHDFARAVQVLRSNGLPREDFQSLGDVFKKQGFVSSPLEERARLIFGTSQELSHSIASIDGVIQARVHLTLPEPDPLSKEVKPATASVLVKYMEGFNLPRQREAIKTLVVNGVEGLTPDRVSVVMVPGRSIASSTPSQTLADSIFGWPGLLGMFGLGLIGMAGWRLSRRPAGVLRQQLRSAAITSLAEPAE